MNNSITRLLAFAGTVVEAYSSSVFYAGNAVAILKSGKLYLSLNSSTSDKRLSKGLMFLSTARNMAARYNRPEQYQMELDPLVLSKYAKATPVDYWGSPSGGESEQEERWVPHKPNT